jgi:hypothetical protein
VVGGLEPLHTRQRLEGFVETPLERRCEGDVADGAAQLADEVVVVLGEVLGEFVAGLSRGSRG